MSALFLILGLTDGMAQRTSARTQLLMNIDLARFRNDDSSSYVEIYYGFYPSLITYVKRDGKLEGVLKVRTRIRDEHTGLYRVNTLSTVPVTRSDTANVGSRSVLISQAGYALPFGEYGIQVSLVDSLAPARTDSVSSPFSMKTFGPSTSISDLELCSSIANSDKKTDLYYKNSLEVIPNPTLVFGATSHPMMFDYAELYNLDPEQAYTVKTQVVGGDGKVIKESSRVRKYGVRHAVEAGMTNVASIQSGKYRLRLELVNEKGATAATSEKIFYAYNPHIQSSLPAASSIKSPELAGLTAQELADEFHRAQYVATEQESSTFDQITSADGRREFLAKFWTEVEAGRLGRPPVLRNVYLQRVLAADERFRAIGRDGWRTDRGRVLILYGEADEIERFPSSQDSKPYEVWHYYSIENGVEFDFVDRSGFGEYTLVNSTKRGELQDTDWQRFLQ